MLPDDPKEPEPKEEDNDTQEEEKPAEPESESAEEPEGEAEKPEGEESEVDLSDEVTETKKTETPEPEKHKRGGGFQRKIERLERQNQLLVEQLSAHRQPVPASKTEAEKTPEEKAAEYIDGLVEKRLAARESQQREKTVVSDFQRRTAEVRAKHEDFEEVVGYADIPVQSALGQALLTSEHGPSIMYELAKSPAELARISALPPLDAAREVGRLEAKLASATPSAKANGSAKRPPAPPTSVNGSASSTRSLEDLPLSEYKRAMRSGRR